MDRILRKTKSELRVTFYVDGVATDATGTPTVTITKDSDGSALVSAQNATKVTGETGVYAYTLTPAQTADVDLLTAEWTATIAGEAGHVFESEAEIVGGFLCSLDAISSALTAATITDPGAAKRRDAREWAETQLEDACNVPFRRRYAKESLDGSGGTDLLLRPRPLTIRTCSVGGTALTASEIADIELYPDGTAYRAEKWAAGRRNVDVVYEHGFKTAPDPVTRAAIKLAVQYIRTDPSNFDERASRIDTEDGSYALVTPGQRGARTSIPEVNQVILDYRYPEIR